MTIVISHEVRKGARSRYLSPYRLSIDADDTNPKEKNVPTKNNRVPKISLGTLITNKKI